MSKVLNKKKVLIIEDDKSLSLILQREIEEYLGLSAYVALDGESGLDKALNNEYALIISDISLPKISGLSLIQKLKVKNIRTPIIIITNYNIEQTEVLAFSSGANIFHKKPLNYDLLRAQIKMLVDNYKFYPCISIGDISIDPIKKVFRKDDKIIELQNKEFNFMLALISSPGEVFTRREILSMNYVKVIDVEESSIDTLVSRLRKRVGKYRGKDVIETVPKSGYRLSLDYLE